MEQRDPSKFERELELLRGMRSDVKLQAHLAAAELRDELRGLEKKWERLREELGRTASHIEAPLREIDGQLERLVGELKSACTRLRDALSHHEAS